jgi:O-antigen/teichoic acid export membrane protein
MSMSLAQRARMAIAWSTAIQLFRDVVQFVLMLVLVRRLPLEAYGQFGLITTITSFLTVFSAREFINHTVLIQDDEKVNYQEQFVVGCLIQGALFVLANLIAVALRWFPAYAPVSLLLHLMSLTFLLDLPSELRARMLDRALDWRRLRLVEAIGVIGGAVLAVILGLSGAGVYALLLPSFIIPACFAIDLFVFVGWRPTWSFHPERFHASRAFGLKRIASISVVSGSNLLESSVLAPAVGYAALGIFNRAQSIATLFCQRVSTLLMTALYPVLARIPTGSDGYRRVSSLVLRAVTWSAIPTATIVALLRSEIVHTLYGDRWVAVIPLVPLGMAVGALLAVVQAAYSLLLAHNQPRQCLYADIWRLAGMALALVIAVPFGLKAYFIGLLIVHSIALAGVLYWLAQGGGLRLSSVAAAFGPAATAAATGALVAQGAFRLFMTNWPAIPVLVVYGSVFGLIYLGSLRLLFPSLLHELTGYFPKSEHVHRWLGFAEAA